MNAHRPRNSSNSQGFFSLDDSLYNITPLKLKEYPKGFKFLHKDFNKKFGTEYILKEYTTLYYRLSCSTFVFYFFNASKACETKCLLNSVHSYFQFVIKLVNCRGVAFCTKWIKEARLVITRYISGNPIRRSDIICVRNGLPKQLHFLKEYLDDRDGIRMVLTILSVYRNLKFGIKPDFTTITDPCTGKSNIKPSEISRALRQLGIRKKIPRSDYSFKGYVLSNKAGPNGPATYSWLKDMNCLSLKQVTDLEIIGGESFRETFHASSLGRERSLCFHSTIDKNYHLQDSDTTRKLIAIPDKEGKTRIIAQFDYFTKCVLKPLHNRLSECLKNIPQDCTYDQSSFIGKLKVNQGKIYSLDLTAATDRMPVSLQTEVLSLLIGKERALAWKSTLTDHAFVYDLYPQRTTKPKKASDDNILGKRISIKYECGQPMGAYSSWPMMAITHHVLVQIAAARAQRLKKESITTFSNYAILGDDCVIVGEDVALQYKCLLDTLGMPINDRKSFISTYYYEFARRSFWKENDVTPFPIGGLISSKGRYYDIHSVLDNASNKGWQSGIDNLIDQIITHCGFVDNNGTPLDYSVYLVNVLNSFRVFRPIRIVRSLLLFHLLSGIHRTKTMDTRLLQISSIFFNKEIPESIIDQGIQMTEIIKSISAEIFTKKMQTVQNAVLRLSTEEREWYRIHPELVQSPAVEETLQLNPLFVTISKINEQAMDLIIASTYDEHWLEDADVFCEKLVENFMVDYKSTNSTRSYKKRIMDQARYVKEFTSIFFTKYGNKPLSSA